MCRDYKKLQNGSDIRGVAMEVPGGLPVNLDEEAVRDLSEGFGLEILQRTVLPAEELKVAIGRDSRLSGESILNVAAETLSGMGFTVYDCGLCSTPAMFMSTIFPEFEADGAIMITASHLPPERNGFKYFFKEKGADKEDISRIIAHAETKINLKKPAVSFEEYLKKSGKDAGEIKTANLMERYSAHLRDFISEALSESVSYNSAGLTVQAESFSSSEPLSGLHVVCDAGNGAGGFFATDVLAPLGADIFGSCLLEPDGNFPVHPPNPENEAAMEFIANATRDAGADLGIIFDTDADRASAVDSTGMPIASDSLCAMAAALVADNYPGSTIVTDSVTGEGLTSFIEENLGLSHLRYKRGYRNVINKAISLNEEGIICPLAIETSGHAAFKDNYFLDDGSYLAALLIIKAAEMKTEGRGIGEIISELVLPKDSREFRIKICAEDFKAAGEKVISSIVEAVKRGKDSEDTVSFIYSMSSDGPLLRGAELVEPNYEGVRVRTKGNEHPGWFLVRLSLHEPLLVMNMQSEEEDGCDAIIAALRQFLSLFDFLKLEGF